MWYVRIILLFLWLMLMLPVNSIHAYALMNGKQYNVTRYLCSSKCWSRRTWRAFLISGSTVLDFSFFSMLHILHFVNLFSCKFIIKHVVINLILVFSETHCLTVGIDMRIVLCPQIVELWQADTALEHTASRHFFNHFLIYSLRISELSRWSTSLSGKWSPILLHHQYTF